VVMQQTGWSDVAFRLPPRAGCASGPRRKRTGNLAGTGKVDAVLGVTVVQPRAWARWNVPARPMRFASNHFETDPGVGPVKAARM